MTYIVVDIEIRDCSKEKRNERSTTIKFTNQNNTASMY